MQLNLETKMSTEILCTLTDKKPNQTNKRLLELEESQLTLNCSLTNDSNLQLLGGSTSVTLLSLFFCMCDLVQDCDQLTLESDIGLI